MVEKELQNQEHKKTEQQNSLLRKTFKWTKRVLVTLVTLVLLSLSVVYIFQDTIIQKALKAFNKGIYGELTVGASSIAPFENFPYLSVLLEDIEIKDSTGQDLMFKLDELYIGIHTLKAVKGVYEVKKIKIEKGWVNAVADTSGQFNLQNAFTFYQASDSEEEADTSATSISAQVNIELIDFDIYYTDEKSEDYFAIKIPAFETELDMEDSLIIDLVSFEIIPLKIQDYDWSSFELHPLKLESDLKLNLDRSYLDLKALELSIGSSQLHVNGTMHYDGLMPGHLFVDFKQIDASIIKPFLPVNLAQEIADLELQDESEIAIEVKGDLGGDFALNLNQRLHFKTESSAPLYTVQNFDLVLHVDLPNVNELSSGKVILDTFDLKKGATHIALSADLNDLDTLHLHNLNLKIHTDIQDVHSWYPMKELDNAKGIIAVNWSGKDIYLSQSTTQITKKMMAQELTVDLQNLALNIPETPHYLKELNGKLYLKNDVLHIEDLALLINNSDLTLNTRVEGVSAFVTGQNKAIKGDLRLDSKHLDFDQLLAYDTALHAQYNDILEHLHLSTSFATTYKDLMDFDLAPKGRYEIKNLELTPTHYKHHIHHFSTVIEVEEDEINIPHFKGNINESDLSLLLNIKGSKGLIDKNHKEKLAVELKVDAEHLIFGDFATYNGEALLDPSYMKEHISGLDFQLELITDPLNFDQGAPLLPNLNLNVHDVHAKLSYHPLKIEDINLKVDIQDENISIPNFSFKIGESDVTMDANLIKPMDWTDLKNNRNKEQINIVAKKLNLDQLMSLASDEHDAEPVAPANTSVSIPEEQSSSTPFDISFIPFPEAIANIEIDTLIADGAKFNTIKVNMSSQKDRLVELRNFSFGIDEGRIIIDRSRIEADAAAPKEYFVFDARNPKDIFARGKIKLYKLSSVDLEKSLGPIMDNMYRDLGLKEFRGQLMDNIILNKLTFNRDLSLRVDDVKAFPHIELAPLDGEKAVKLVGFQALEMLKDYFKSYDIEKFELGNINLNFKVKEGEILFTHSLKIQTSIGPIQIQKDSYYKLDMSEMNMIYQIPGKIVSRAVMGTMFGNKNNEKSKVDDNEVLKPYYIHFIMKGDEMYTKIYTSRADVNELNDKRAKLGEEKFFKKYIKI